MIAAAKPRRNFLLIQALRGLAALWVVLFHISKGQYLSGFTARLPAWIDYLVFDYGSAGVAVFFVLSGFVISHSLTGRSMDARGFARFIARRSLRLDPPYWASIALTLAVGALYTRARGMSLMLPNSATVFGNMAYAQDLLWLPEIVPTGIVPPRWGAHMEALPHHMVYWTLAYEVQFYLVLALAWWATAGLIVRGLAGETARLLVFVPLGALALVSAAIGREWALHGLFVNLWHGFFLGVLAYAAGVKKLAFALPALLALCAVTLLGAARTDAVFGTPCALTALLLLAAARTGHLDRGLAGRGWQVLGRISYSLYLVHVPLILLGFGIWGRLAGRGLTADLAGLLLVGGGIITAAAVFWWAVERPSLALSARLFAQRAGPR